MANKMKKLVDTNGNEVSTKETPGLRATIPQTKLSTTAKDQTTRVVDMPSTVYNPVTTPGTPAGTIQVNTPTVEKNEPSYLQGLPGTNTQYPTLDLSSLYAGLGSGGGNNIQYPSGWGYGSAPTWSYNKEAPGAFLYAERPGEFQYDVAAPGEFQYDVAQPAAFLYDVAQPDDFQYDQARPAAFTYDESGRPAEFSYEAENARPGEFTYDAAPEYANAYQDRINAMVDQILNRGAFSYNYLEDPLYQQYEEAYTRNGNAAMQDTLAQVSARTGGLASSYAGTAAQQTYDQYMQALNDKIPELYQLAYGMYQDEGNTMRNNLAMVQGLENTDYGRYADRLAQYNVDRNLAFNNWQYGQDQYNTDRAFEYNKYLNSLDQWNADRSFAYGKYQDELNQYNNERNFEYNKYLNDLDQYNTNRNFAYNQYLNDLDQYNNNRNFAYNKYLNDVDQYNTNRNFAYGQWQDQQNLYDTDRNFAYNQHADELNRYYTDRNFDYGLYQDKLAQYNTDRNLSYKQYQDAIDQANIDRAYNYQVQQDALDRQENAALREYQAAVDAWNAQNGKSSTSTTNKTTNTTTTKRSYDDLYNSGVNDYGTAYKAFIDDGYSPAEAKEMATYYAKTYYKNKRNGSKESAQLLNLPRTSAADVGNGAMRSALETGDMSAYTTIKKVDGGFGNSGYQWNGKTYATIDGLEKAIAKEEKNMTDREKQLLQWQFQINGIDLSF